MGNLDEKIALVTGANSGLGFDTAQALLEKKATVILGCRSIERAEKARDKLLAQTSGGNIELLQIDLADLVQVNNAADEIIFKFTKAKLFK